MMLRHAKRLAKGLVVGTLLTVYQAPGCNFALDEAALQEFIASLGGFSEVKFEFEAETAGDFEHPDNHDEFAEG